MWIIPDIHACFYSLQSLIQRIDPPKESEILIFLGDYINKGLYPEKTLDYLLELKERYESLFLLGNHDQLLLSYWETPDSITKDKLISLGSGSLLDAQERYRNFFSNTYHYISTSNHLIVHAGFDFTKDDPFAYVEDFWTIREMEYNSQKAGAKQIIRGHYPVSLTEIKRSITNQSNIISLDNGCVYDNRKDQGNLIAFDLMSKEWIVQPNVDQR